MNVLLRFAGGKIDEIRGFSHDCPLDAGGRRFIWLGSVKPEEILHYGVVVWDGVVRRNVRRDVIVREAVDSSTMMSRRDLGTKSIWYSEPR